MKKQIGILIFVMLSLIASAQTLEDFNNFIKSEAQSNNELLLGLNLAETQVTPNQELYDVYFYSLDIEVFPEIKELHGKVEVCANVLSPLGTMELNYTKTHEVDGVYLAEYPDSALNYQHNSDMLYVQLDKTYTAGDDVKIIVEFTSKSLLWEVYFSTYEGSSLIFNWLYSAWFPCKKAINDKADSTDMRVTVPGDLVVASNGMLQEVSHINSTSTYFWQERYPIAPYLIFFAAHPYEIHTDWYVNENKDSMEIQMYTIPSVYDKVKDRYAKEKDMLAYFEEHFGPYPYYHEKYGHAETTIANSASFQTMTGFSKDAVQDEYGEYTIAHELAHSWMGNSVTTESWHHVWIIEGFATYAGYNWWDYNYHDILDLDSIMGLAEYYGSGTIYVEDPETQKIWDNNLSYIKPCWVYHMLRHIVGETTFFNIIKAITSDPECAHGIITTDRFREIAEQVSGMNLKRFFQQWIFGEYYPNYSCRWKYAEKESGYELELTIDQVQYQVQQRQLFWMPVDVAVQTASGVENFVIWDSLETQTFYLEVDDLPQSITLDPDNWLLNKVTDITNITGMEDHLSGAEMIRAVPNPFGEFVDISFTLPYFTDISIRIFNQLGQEVKHLVEGPLQAGTHSITWDAEGNDPGIYFVTVRSKEFVRTEKIVKL